MILITSGMETNIAMSTGNTDEILSKEGNIAVRYSHINVINFSRLVCNSSKSFFFFYDYVDNFVQA